MPYIYILECTDGTYYVGSSWHVLERLEQHNDGPGSVYTRSRLPVTSVHVEEYPSIADAFGREEQVQTGIDASEGLSLRVGRRSCRLSFAQSGPGDPMVVRRTLELLCPVLVGGIGHGSP